MTAGCLEESTVLAFLGGALPPDQRSEVEAHVAACSACADLVTWAAADQATDTARLPGQEGRPFVGQLQPGARVGRYQILYAVGRGGMGEVYAAYHPDLDRRIAVKVVHGAGSNTGERRVRLLREARAIARLRHANVVTVHDAGTFGDRVFIAMELVDGVTIEQWLRAERRDWRQILDVYVAAGRGLAAAHAAGVVHRDFKQQNVMIAKDGSVRVMDFGLARMAEDETADARASTDEETTVSLGPATKTGAFIGTPAYMSPEQFRRESTDARADQFSFCVALHEALLGSRPVAANAEGGSPAGADPAGPRPTGVPGWLRAAVLRGAAPDRERRWPSMNALLGALERGRTRTQRRLSMFAAGAAVVLLSAGGWKLARGDRFACSVPKERTAAAWSIDPSDPRRQAIHRAFAASGRATAETSWQRVSATLDEYIGQWSAMYTQACEATHIRGEQSAEVLDLRMSCLADNLDQVHALTDAFATADAVVVGRAVTATKDLTPVSRCADVLLLKSAVPLPRDEKTLLEVQNIRRSLAEIVAMREVGKMQPALEKARALRPRVEATGYKVLLGELLGETGNIEAGMNDDGAQQTLEEAIFVAEGSRDDSTAVKAAADLIYTLAIDHDDLAESIRWARFADAKLVRLGAEHSRTKAWVLHNISVVLAFNGELEKARPMLEQAITLKEQVLGIDHPDVAISLDGLAWVLNELGRYSDAIAKEQRAIQIHERFSDPESYFLGNDYANLGNALIALGRTAEGRIAFTRSLEILDAASTGPFLADALSGMAEVQMLEGDDKGAVENLERAIRIYEEHTVARTLAADVEYNLARALWKTGGSQRRALHLAEAARETYVAHGRLARAERCRTWLAAHRPR